MALTLVACSETEEESEYVNWQARNQHYIDSIASVCEANEDGCWEKMLAFNLNDSVESVSPNNNHFIYIHKEAAGKGTYSPIYNDSIRVHYLGRLIPSTSYPQGYIFGKSYSTYVLNENTDVPTLMAVSQNIVGFATATLNMVEGDQWKVYIPYYLGYGETDNSTTSIPGYSTLIFDIKLAKIYKYQIDKDTTWY
ncbi:MAG: FKBP-type peptidyl-prolyl cis-trans isomerase [Bacteroidaceae bacterium]|nr:FKBP-type peptidyl-prolyl cis-trans isomerase [Bacteroidaceae bacterium]